MLDFFRSHQRLMQFLLLLLIFPSFVFFGIEGYSRFSGDKQSVAEVDGKAISQGEFDFVLRQQEAQMRDAGEQASLRAPAQRMALLNRIVDERVLGKEIDRLHFNAIVPDAVLSEYMSQLPLAVQLRKADGTVDRDDYYKAVQVQQGMNREQHDAYWRSAFATEHLVGALRGTALASRNQIDTLIKLTEQEREIQVKILRPADFAANLNPTEKDLKAYYEVKRVNFTVPEEAKIEYVEFSAENLAKQIEVSEAMLHDAYQANLAHYRDEEQRRASHILLAVAKEAKAEERAAARAKAENLLTVLRAKPEAFAEMAKKESSDVASAERGGDLGFFSQGMMVKPFEEAVYKLKEGQISDIVESDFGFHVIKLTAIKQAKTKSLEEVKPELLANLKRDLATKRFNESAESFSNLVYEQYASLQPAADQFKLSIVTADHLGRQPNPALAKEAVLKNEKLLAAVFSDDAIKNKRNTQAIAIAPQTLVAARVVSYRPLSVRPFDEVRAEVLAQWMATTSATLAKQAGEKLLAKPESITEMSAPFWVQRFSDQVPRAALTSIFRGDVKKLPVVVGVDLGNAGYALYRITQFRQPTTVAEDKSKAALAGWMQENGAKEYRAYLDALRARFKVELNLPVTEEPVSGS